VCLVQPVERKIEESKLILEGLVQHYKVVNENDKNKHLVDLLDNLDFNQVRRLVDCCLLNLHVGALVDLYRALLTCYTWHIDGFPVERSASIVHCYNVVL
jgi:hypothetical protein